jgi:hypothetical protein
MAALGPTDVASSDPARLPGDAAVFVLREAAADDSGAESGSCRESQLDREVAEHVRVVTTLVVLGTPLDSSRLRATRGQPVPGKDLSVAEKCGSPPRRCSLAGCPATRVKPAKTAVASN